MRSLTKMQLLVLTVLLRCPMHPYALRQEIIELTSTKIWPAKSSLRRVLDKLMEVGYIQECQSNPHYWLKARRGVPYEITDAGYERVRRELSTYCEVFAKSRSWLNKFDA